MPSYAYQGYTLAGEAVADRIDADSEDQALRKLQSQGYAVLHLELSRDTGPRRRRQARGRVKLEEVGGVARELALLVKAGIPINEALQGIAGHTPNRQLAVVLSQCYDEVMAGKSLSQAMGAETRIFPQVLRDMVRTAEETGNLGAALEQASCYLEQSLELRRKVVAALTYPVVLICASVLVLAFLLTFVMPKFMKLFDKMKVQLPGTTKALLAVSNFLLTKWYIPIIAIVVLMAFFVWMRRTERGQLFLARLFGKIPLVGDLALKIAVARLLSAMGAMLQAGVPLMGALQTGADTSGHLLISRRIRRVKERVQEGVSLSEAAAEGGELPPLAIQMMSAGEKTGKLAEILPGVGAYYEREVEARVRSLTSILEPLMILGLGIVIGFITVSIISPIYTLVGSQR